MAIYLIDITARLLVDCTTDAEAVAGNICSRVEEQLIRGDTLLDIELETTTLPFDIDGDGSLDSGRRTCPEEHK